MTNTCFYCHKPKDEQFAWRSILPRIETSELLDIETYLCRECIEEIEQAKQLIIGEDACLRCQRPNKKKYLSQPESLVKHRKYVRVQEDFMAAYAQFFAIEDKVGLLEHPLCFDCLRWLEGDNQPLLFNRSVMANSDWIKEALVRYKYRQDVRWRYIFALFMVEEVKRLQSYQDLDYLIPIPLNPSRIHERHFDHMQEIACLVSDETDIPILHGLMVNEKVSQKQSKQGRQERIQNLLQKFIKNSYVNVDIVNKSILLLDDIYTTGSTLHAAAHCLRECGARQIISVCLARSI